jgi:hypothetical protein
MRPPIVAVVFVVSVLGVAVIANGAENSAPAWKKAEPGTHAFLGDDGGGTNTKTVCDTADRYRDWLNGEHPPGCQTFQHDLPVTIEVVIFDPVHETQGDAALPLVKIHIPFRNNFIGYTQLLGLHPVIPAGTKMDCKETTEGSNFELFATSKMEDKGRDLGDHVSTRVIKYDPTKDDDLEFYVEVLDGNHAGQKGWMLDKASCHGEDDIPITQFSKAVLPVLPASRNVQSY